MTVEQLADHGGPDDDPISHGARLHRLLRENDELNKETVAKKPRKNINMKKATQSMSTEQCLRLTWNMYEPTAVAAGKIIDQVGVQ